MTLIETETELHPSVQADAAEFGTHIKTGGWRLGLLVVRSVTPGEGTGRPPKDRLPLEGGKISARAFAERSGTSHKRVGRYFVAWQKAADTGLVPDPVELDPGDEIELPDGKLWSNFYSNTRTEAPLPAQFARALDKLDDVSAELLAAVGDAEVDRTELNTDLWGEQLADIRGRLDEIIR